MRLGAFETGYLGRNYPRFFEEWSFDSGVGPDWTHRTYGIGITERDALEDCIEMLAQSDGIDLTDQDKEAIRAEYGECSDSFDPNAEENDDGEVPYHAVGIRYNLV